MENILILDLEPEIKYISRILGESIARGIYHSSYRYPIVNGSEFFYSNGNRISSDIELSDIMSDVHDINGTRLLGVEEIETGTYSFNPFLGTSGAILLQLVIEFMQYITSDFKPLYFNDELGIDSRPLISSDLESMQNTLEMLGAFYPRLTLVNDGHIDRLHDFIEQLYNKYFQHFMSDTSRYYELDISRRHIRLIKHEDVRLIRYNMAIDIQSRGAALNDETSFDYCDPNIIKGDNIESRNGLKLYT